jgi:hypothetical protein
MKQFFEHKLLNQVNLEVGNEIFSINIKSMLLIDENNLSEQSEKAAAIHGYLSILKAKLSRKCSDLELELNVLFSELFLITKEDDSFSRVSDKHAESSAFEDKRHITKARELNQAKEQFHIISGLVESFKLKINLIQTISANLRNSNQ